MCVCWRNGQHKTCFWAVGLRPHWRQANWSGLQWRLQPSKSSECELQLSRISKHLQPPQLSDPEMQMSQLPMSLAQTAPLALWLLVQSTAFLWLCTDLQPHHPNQPCSLWGLLLYPQSGPRTIPPNLTLFWSQTQTSRPLLLLCSYSLSPLTIPCFLVILL